MSNQIALAAVTRMNSQACLMAPQHVSDMAAAMQQLSRAEVDREQANAANSRKELLATYGYSDSPTDSKPFAFAAGLAFIPIHGVLINRFGASWGYITGYNFIRAQMNAAEADPDVLGIIFDVNSYGGEAAGCFELCADIAALTKPTLSVVDSAAYSAGYAIASSADKVIVTPSGGAGSIGVIAVHISMERMLDAWGIDVTMITDGEHKADGNPYQQLPEDVRNDIQASVNKSGTAFKTLVAENMGLDIQVVTDTQARTYRADDALALGLIDEVATPVQAVTAFFNELSGSTTHQENSMSAQSQASQPGAESATTATNEQLAEARKAERERMQGITGCEEAAGKSKLANHLALNTDLSVEQAREILKNSAPEEKADTGKQEAGASAFMQAMDKGNNPSVGADAEAGGGQEQMTPGKRLVADYAMAIGRKLQ